MGWKKGLPRPEETKAKIGKTLQGHLVSSETRSKIGFGNLGNKVWLGRKHTAETIRKMRVAHKGRNYRNGRGTSLETKLKIANAQRGDKSHRWRGGMTEINRIIRGSPEYRQWKRSVFTRDEFTCQACGLRGGKLEADHELPFALFPALRFEVLNGRTLCKPCHRKTPTYGNLVPSFLWDTHIKEYAADVVKLCELL